MWRKDKRLVQGRVKPLKTPSLARRRGQNKALSCIRRQMVLKTINVTSETDSTVRRDTVCSVYVKNSADVMTQDAPSSLR